MRLNANDIVSLATVRSMRNVLVATSIVLFLKLEDGVSQGTWNFFGQELSNTVVLSYAPWVICFLMLGHALHWAGDVRAYRNWFTENNVSLDAFDRVLEANPLKAMLKQIASVEKTRSGIQNNLDRAQEGSEGSTDVEELRVRLSALESAQGTLASLNEGLPKSIDLLESIGPRHKELVLWARLHLYGWYFLLPLVLSACAILF